MASKHYTGPVSEVDSVIIGESFISILYFAFKTSLSFIDIMHIIF